MWPVMSSSTCTVIFFFCRLGPVILTSLRRKVSPEPSAKKVRKATSVSWPAAAISPTVPLHR